MNKELLLEIINNNDEREWVEFKTNYPAEKHAQDIGEYISALSNSATLHKQNYAYMIWGVENNTRKILGTDFKYDLDINGSEVFKHYLARNLEPRISFKFEEVYIDDKRLVALIIPATKDVITEFNHERFIRIGSSKEKLKKFPKYEAELWAELSGSNDITNIESRRTHLTFQILKNYLSTHNYHYNDSTFEENLGLRTKNGEYNLMAELLADENDIVINVATFATNDKTEYLKRNEFGGKCLLLAMEQAKNYIEAINQIYVDTKVRPRKEKPMFNMDAFKEAWYNACVHYKWSEANNPGIYVYVDRLEIESFGGIPSDLSKRQFLLGVSKPVNKRLFEIFKTCGFVEESGHGVPTVTKAYGDESYIFDGKFIKVVIPFDRSGFTNTTQEIDNTTQKTTQEHESTTQKTTQERLIELLKANPNLSRSDLATLLKLSEDGVKYQIKKLKDKGIIKRVGPDKGGYWEVIE
ncbi:MAG: winged helix-turn-helix transcriptional regulator [Clostridiales bacterium]|nr:winged helix-turn-helix transcriptional regulator [Clostridiales bacterium]